jgi:hypothetical protein
MIAPSLFIRLSLHHRKTACNAFFERPFPGFACRQRSPRPRRPDYNVARPERRAMPVKLDEHHQRRLEATMQLLEESIARCERWLAGSGEGIVRVVRASIDPRERQRLANEIERLRMALERFAAHFELQARPVDLAQVLNAEFSTAWVMLENCRPKRMKGYGVAFDPETAAALNSGIDQLLEEVESLRKEIAGAAETRARDVSRQARRSDTR